MRASVAVRSGVVMPSPVVTRSRALVSTAVVARSRVFRPGIAGTRNFIAVSIVIGLRGAVAVHLLAGHRTIVVHISLRTRHRTIFRATVRASVCAGRDDPGAVEFSGTRGGGDCRSAMILRGQKLAVAAGAPLVVALQVGGLEMVFAAPHFLFMRRSGVNSAVAAVVADAIYGDIVDDGLVVDVNVGDGHVVHGAVVVEVAISPIATLIAGAKIAEAVIHSTIEADVRSPVACVP